MRLPVWAYLVFGPLIWMAIFAPFIDRSTRDGLNIAFLYAMCFCLNLGVVSHCIPWIQGDQRAGGD